MVVMTPLFSNSKYFGIDGASCTGGSGLLQQCVCVWRSGLKEVPRGPFHHRAFEEIRICGAEELHRVGEQEVAQVSFADEPILDQLVCLAQHFGHVHHVEMSNI